jgi:hypothetical protein
VSIVVGIVEDINESKTDYFEIQTNIPEVSLHVEEDTVSGDDVIVNDGE